MSVRIARNSLTDVLCKLCCVTSAKGYTPVVSMQ